MNRNDQNLKIESLLKQVETLIDKQNEIKKATGENFNIFTVLKMERNEVETHSALIFELINPYGSHSQGRLFLDEFVKDVLGEKNFKTDGYINVEREKYCGDEGRIDLWIENDEKNLIIEMKVDADDQENQLKRYKKYAEKKKKEFQIFYLTLFGSEASEKSKGKGKEQVECKDISFQVDVLGWIENSIKLVPLKPVLRETLRQYSVLIRKITNLASQESEMEIVKTLLKDNNLIVADQIARSLPRAKAEVEYIFWKSLYEKIKCEKEMPFVYDSFDIFEKHDFKKMENDIIDEIVKERKKKNGEMGIHYFVGDVKNDVCGLFSDIGAFTDGKLYVSLFFWDEEKEGESISKITLKDLQDACKDMGFSKPGESYVELSCSYEDIFMCFCKGTLDSLSEKVKVEVIEIYKKIQDYSGLKNMLK